MLLNRTKKPGAVYGGRATGPRRDGGALALLAVSSDTLSASAAPGDGAIVDAREALRKKDRKGLGGAPPPAMASNHPLAQWADYFELSNRLPEAQQSELDAFYARWPPPTSRTGCATTGCSSSASARLGQLRRRVPRVSA